MTTTARQALSALIDDLVATPARAPQAPMPTPRLASPTVAVTAVEPPPAPVVDLAPAPAPVALPVAMPQQRTAPQAYTVLPTGARNAILWRSRTA